MKALAIGLALSAIFLAAALWYAIIFPRQPVRGAPPPLSAEERDLARRLEAHVTAVASRPHNVAHPAELEAAARHIETTLAELGYKPVLQSFTARGVDVRNIEAVIEPEVPADTAESYVIGAHYDSAGRSPGANDNGTGVGALLELARLFAGWRPQAHRLRLVFWVNEEQPFSKTDDMGSLRHARRLRERSERLAGAISLETLGYFSGEPGSQKFPFPFALIYADKGNFAAFVGLPGSRALVHRALGAFRRHAVFPSIGGVAPGFIKGIDYSDHWSYDHVGYPALMITDTAPFRNPYYHTAEDLPDRVDYDSLARITKGLEGMVRDLVR